MNILLVDDDPDSRLILSKQLIYKGHNIIEAEDGIAALDRLESNDFHLIFSDIIMPKMTGLELLKKVKDSETHRDITVVLFTGYGDVKNAVEAIKLGAYDYVTKPVNLEELFLMLTRIEEYIKLKEDNKALVNNFNEKLNEATTEIKKELEDVKKAYANAVGIKEIGVFSNDFEKVHQLALKLHNDKSIPVLIEGETGTGKEIIARLIHYGKGNTTTPFIGLNCAAITQNLFESELFGYGKSAFTGASSTGQKGKIELAENGSIFLDEIGELPNEYQAKLLRVIQEKEYYRVGGLVRRQLKARVITATNVDVEQMVSDGRFREDLYFRLNVGHIRIPPLRKRTDEIMPLAKMFLNQLYEENKTEFCSFTDSAERMLLSHHWPGNIRELKNVIERLAFYFDDEEEVKPEHLSFLNKGPLKKEKQDSGTTFDLYNLNLPTEGVKLEKLVENLVIKALEIHDGNKTDAARFLGISRGTIYTYLKRTGKND